MNKSDMLQLGHAPLKLEEDVGVADGATALEAETAGGEDVVEEVPVEFGDGVDALPLVNLDSEDDAGAGGRDTSVSAFRLLLLLLFRLVTAALLLACTAAAAAAAAAVVKL